jgi:hypothetical protein
VISPTQVAERKVSSNMGRLCLMVVVFFFFLASVGVLLWIGRDGGISYDLKIGALGKLAAFYMPLLTLMAAFYFGGSRSKTLNAIVPLEAFVFAVIVVTLWVIVPIFLLLTLFIEDVAPALERVKPYGDSLALLAVGYYFSQDHVRQKSVPKRT